MTACRLSVSTALAAAALALVVAGPAGAQVRRSVEDDLERVSRSALAHRPVRGMDAPAADPVIEVMVRGDVSPGAVRALGGDVGTVAGGVMTVRLPLSAAPRIARLEGVESMRLALPLVKHNDLAIVDTKANQKRTQGIPHQGWSGTNVIVGFIDSGIQYQHDDFKNPDGSTRLISIWDQQTSGTAPSGFFYGNECNQAQINAGTCSQTDIEGHGTHVAGSAVGDGSATGNAVPQFKYSGMANDANIIMVKTTFTDAALVDGVNYIFQKAAGLGRPAVVNMSLGTNLGPHDGKSDLELQLNALVGPGRILVSSAGNNATSQTHGRLTATSAPMAPDSASFTIPAYTGSASADFFLLDGWAEGTDTYSISVRSPSGIIHGPVARNTFYSSPAAAGDPRNASGRVYIENGFLATANGDENIYIEVNDLGGAPRPAAGTWKILVTPVSVSSPGKVHFWSYSNLTPSFPEGIFTTRQTSDETVSSPSTADSVICVGAHVTRASWLSSEPGQAGPWGFGETLNAIASFSGAGPRRDGVMKPDISAPGSAIASTLSTTWQAAGAAWGFDPRLVVDDTKHAIQQGTSMASPVVAGAVAMMLEQEPTMGPTRARQRLTAGARVDAFVTGQGAVPNKRFGYGKLDLGSVLPNLDTTLPTVTLTRPNGGETFLVGTSEAINWTAADNIGVTSITLESSSDGGANWALIASDLPNTGTYAWDVPNTVSSNSMVRATAFDTQNQASDASNATFTIASGVDSGNPSVAFSVSRPTPSPFSGATTIGFAVPGTTGGLAVPVKVRIFNLAGRLVRTALDAPLPAGPHSALWDGADDRGVRQASGVYFIEVSTPDNVGRVRAVYLR